MRCCLPDPGLSTGYGHEFLARGHGAWGDLPFTDLMDMTDAASPALTWTPGGPP